MRTSFTGNSPVARLSAGQKLAVGAVLATVGGAIITLYHVLGWSALPRPWGFIIGFVAGVTGGTGVPLAVCGLIHARRHRLRRNPESHRNSCA